MLHALLRPRTLGAAILARLLGRYRADRLWHGAPGLRPSTHPLRRERLARDVLHDWDGALSHEYDGHGVGANAVARDAAGGVGGVEEGRVGWLGRAPRRSARRPSRYTLRDLRCRRPSPRAPLVSSPCNFRSAIA